MSLGGVTDYVLVLKGVNTRIPGRMISGNTPRKIPGIRRQNTDIRKALNCFSVGRRMNIEHRTSNIEF